MFSMCLVILTSIGARHDNFGEAIDYWSVKGYVQPSLTLQRKVGIFFWWVGGEVLHRLLCNS